MSIPYPPYEADEVRVDVEGQHVVLTVRNSHTWGHETTRLTIRQSYELGQALARAGLYIRKLISEDDVDGL